MNGLSMRLQRSATGVTALDACARIAILCGFGDKGTNTN